MRSCQVRLQGDPKLHTTLMNDYSTMECFLSSPFKVSINAVKSLNFTVMIIHVVKYTKTLVTVNRYIT